MATKTVKKTTAKKPTTKKPASKKTVSKAVAKKPAVTKKAVAKKTAPAKVETKTTVSKSGRPSRPELTPMQKLRSLHISNFISYTLLAIISFFAIGTLSKEVLLNYQARDLFEKTEGVVLASANEVLFSIEYRYIIVAALALGAIGSLLLATKLRSRYEPTVKAGVSGMRWLFIGITTAVIIELASFMGGVQDIMTIKLVAGLIVLAAIFGWINDRDNAATDKPRKFAFYASILAYVLALLPLAASHFGTLFYGSERFGWNVYAMTGVALVAILGTLYIQRSSIKHKAKFEYIVFEQRYIRLDQVVKFLAVLVLLGSIN